MKLVIAGCLASFVINSSVDSFVLERNQFFEKLQSEAEEKAQVIEKPYCYIYDENLCYNPMYEKKILN